MKYYTGVGSRETPLDVIQVMSKLAHKLQSEGFVLRSGGADGADMAFEHGARIEPMVVQPDIYIPWEGFNGCSVMDGYKCPSLHSNSVEATASAIVEDVHPVWGKLSRGAKALHTRNVFQVLGDNLDNPSSFLVCWAITDKHGTPKGGTRTAWEVAKMYNVKCFNLYNEKDLARISEWMDK